MNEKIKEKIVKTLIIITGIPVLYVCMVPIIAIIGNDKLNDFWSKYINLAFLLVGIFGMLMIISMIVFNVDLTSKKSKPIKKELVFSSYTEFKKSIVDYLFFEGFQVMNTNIKEFKESELYFRKSKEFLKSKLDFVLFIKLDDLEKDNIDDKILSFLEEKYPEQPANLVTFTTILCVDKVTNSFNNYITTSTKQAFSLIKLYIGISLEDNNLYIVTQKDGPSIDKYRKLKKWFEKALNNCKER